MNKDWKKYHERQNNLKPDATNRMIFQVSGILYTIFAIRLDISFYILCSNTGAILKMHFPHTHQGASGNGMARLASLTLTAGALIILVVTRIGPHLVMMGIVTLECVGNSIRR